MSNLYGAERKLYIGRDIQVDGQTTTFLDRAASYLAAGDTKWAEESLQRARDLIAAKADKVTAVNVVRAFTLSGQLCTERGAHDEALRFYLAAGAAITKRGLRRRAVNRRTAEVAALLNEHDKVLAKALEVINGLWDKLVTNVLVTG